MSPARLPGQFSLFQPHSEWKPPSVDDVLNILKGASLVGLDTETYDPWLQADKGPGMFDPGSRLIGISLANQAREKCYIPIGHCEGNVEDPAKFLAIIKEWSTNFEGTLLGANINYDLGYLLVAGIDFRKAKIFDIQVADALVYELHRSYSLQSIATRRGFEGKDETLLRDGAYYIGCDPKKEMHRIPAKFVGPYAEQDADLLIDIYFSIMADVEKHNLGQILDVECRLTPALVHMRHKGVKVNFDELDVVDKWALASIKENLAELNRQTGVYVDIQDVDNKSGYVKALKSVGIVLEKTPTGQDKLDKAALKGINHPVAKLIRTAKAMSRLRGFVASVNEYAINGYVHPTFNQMRGDDENGNSIGAAYGRMSCSNPAMQQQPAKNDHGSGWRKIYVAEQDRLWACLDFSSQEPRMGIHFASKARLPGIASIVRQFHENPRTDTHQAMADMAGIARDPAKIIFLGIMYGMGGSKLCHSLGLPVATKVGRDGETYETYGEEGWALRKKYDEYAPWVNALSELAKARVKEKGFIRTLLGRVCHFPYKNGELDWIHKALNRLIQGSSADQTKLSTALLHEEGYDLRLQVHDELDIIVDSPNEAKGAAEIMEHSVQLEVPSVVDVECGANWGELKNVG